MKAILLDISCELSNGLLVEDSHEMSGLIIPEIKKNVSKFVIFSRDGTLRVMGRLVDILPFLSCQPRIAFTVHIGYIGCHDYLNITLIQPVFF